MAISLSNTSILTTSFLTGVAQTVTSSVGNLSIVTFHGDSGASITSVTDSKGNVYFLATKSSGTSGDVEIWYAPNAATGIVSVTFNWSGGGAGNATCYDCSGANTANPLGDVEAESIKSELTTTNALGSALCYNVGGGIVITGIGLTTGSVSSIAAPFTIDLDTGTVADAHDVFWQCIS